MRLPEERVPTRRQFKYHLHNRAHAERVTGTQNPDFMLYGENCICMFCTNGATRYIFVRKARDGAVFYREAPVQLTLL